MATIIVLIVLAVILFFLGRSFIRDRKNGGCSGCTRLRFSGPAMTFIMA